MTKILVVIDMQNDFVTGSLANKDAQAIVSNVVAEIVVARVKGMPIVYTRDTHRPNYLETQEGKRLPVKHCIAGSKGHSIIPEISNLYDIEEWCFNKYVFSLNNDEWEGILEDWGDIDFTGGSEDEIEIVGVCTDICVIANALSIKTQYPDVRIVVDASCCAGTTPEKHKAALEVMKSCQIDVINE